MKIISDGNIYYSNNQLKDYLRDNIRLPQNLGEIKDVRSGGLGHITDINMIPRTCKNKYGFIIKYTYYVLLCM